LTISNYSNIIADDSIDTLPKPIAGLRVENPYRLIKLGIWAYFLLIIFEGALRKWVFPGLSTPLLLIRDPLALWLIYLTWKRGLLTANFYLTTMVITGIVGTFTTLFLGHGNFPIAIYGARIIMLHFPLIFVIGKIFDREDVIKLGQAILWMTAPMAILIALQFYSPQSAWVNRGVGGNIEGGGFSGALGYMRPPATFSFTSGTSQFFSLAAGFIFYFWFYPQRINRLILFASTAGLLAAIPLSISRGLFYSIAVTLAFAVIATTRKPKYLGRMVFAIIGGAIVLIALNNTSFFQTSTEAFTSRFEGATEHEGGIKGSLVDRYLGDLLLSFSGSSDLPFFGYGLGIGTNVGRLVQPVLNIEHEWARVVGELGLLLGVTVIFIRLALSGRLAIASYHKLLKGDPLPWMLLSYCFLNLPLGQWGQPTALGFGTLIGGLMIASLRSSSNENHNNLQSD